MFSQDWESSRRRGQHHIAWTTSGEDDVHDLQLFHRMQRMFAWCCRIGAGELVEKDGFADDPSECFSYYDGPYSYE